MKTQAKIFLSTLLTITSVLNSEARKPNIIACPSLPAQEKSPNILFIAVDDMNDWIGPLGGLSITKTPNLDKLAGESMVFTNAHCASPACSPSRLSIMTGIRPARSGVMENEWYDGPEWRKLPVMQNIESLEEFFQNKGYTTFAGGKIYHTLAPPWLTLNHADPDTWDYYFPSAYIPIPHQIRAPQNVIFPEGMKGTHPHSYFTWAALDIPDEKMADQHVVDWALHELGREQELPLFLAVGLFRPHMPWEVPQKYFDMYPLDSIPDLQIQENDLMDAHDHNRRHWHKYVIENNEWKKVIHAYLACISFADAQISRLMEGLKNSRYAENTIVVLWADHGMHIGEKENWEKFTLWEESTRVPLIIRAPGITRAGSTSAEPVSLLDIYPTLASLAGFSIPSHCDGESLVPYLRDPERLDNSPALTS
ncbi:MAG: sulfatase, partial [Bacteroidales bacterium]|nr:sulfatase [Bacteroidales bacterium]